MKTKVMPLFFVLTLLLSWLAWVPAAIAKLAGESSALGPDGLIGGLARWSPGLVAIVLALLLGGKTEVRALFRPLKTWRIGPGWYLFALLFQPGLFFAAKMVDGLRGVAPDVASPLVSIYGAQAAFMIPMVILFAFPGALAEELGWRGFALPRLQEKVPALVASLVIALVWGVWHIPLLIYFGEIRPDEFTGMAVAVFNFIPLTILYTWLYNHTRGSLLLATLFHLGQQFSNSFLGTWPTMTDEIITWALALLVVIFWWKENPLATS